MFLISDATGLSIIPLPGFAAFSLASLAATFFFSLFFFYRAIRFAFIEVGVKGSGKTVVFVPLIRRTFSLAIYVFVIIFLLLSLNRQRLMGYVDPFFFLPYSSPTDLVSFLSTQIIVCVFMLLLFFFVFDTVLFYFKWS